MSEKWIKSSYEERLYQYEGSPQCIFCDRPTYTLTWYYPPPKGSGRYNSFVVCPYCGETNANCGGYRTFGDSLEGLKEKMKKRYKGIAISKY